MKYQTVLSNGFSRQIGDEPRANGGVELVQLGRRNGDYFMRRINANGKFESKGKAERVSKADATALIDRAIERLKNDRLNGRETEAYFNREMSFLEKLVI